MSLRIEPKDLFSEPELSLHETIRKLTRERDSALHQVAGLEVQVLELGLSREDAFTAIFQRGMSSLRNELLSVIEDQKKEFEEFKRLVAPVLVERQIRLKEEAAEKEEEEKEAALNFVPNTGFGQICKEKLRELSLDQIAQFREKEGSKFVTNHFWKEFAQGTISFPMKEPV